MVAPAITNMKAQLQAEVSPGTAITNAMKRYLGIKLRPGYNVEGGEGFKPDGHKVDTVYTIGDVWSVWGVEGVQDFNSLGAIAKSVLGTPVTEPVAGVAGAYKHVFTPKADNADDLNTYTVQWGNEARAFQAAMFAFQSLSLGVQRGQLSLTSSAISRKIDKSATFVTAGVSDVAAVPIPSRGYNVYADDTWAALGTTKLLACYNADISNPDKYTPDAPINSAIDGFESLLEGEDLDYTANFTLGFDAAGADMIDTFENEAIKFFRIAANGPVIEGTTRYGITYDTAVRIRTVGEVTTAPNSSTTVLPFEGGLIKDTVSGKFQELTLINTVASY